MLSIIKTISLHGLEGYLIDVQVDITGGMPTWEIIRLTRYKHKRSKRKSKNSYKKFWLWAKKQKNTN